MVKSSIIVPAQSTGSASRKRSMDQDDEHSDNNNAEKATDDNETEVNRSTTLAIAVHWADDLDYY